VGVLRALGESLGVAVHPVVVRYRDGGEAEVNGPPDDFRGR